MQIAEKRASVRTALGRLEESRRGHVCLETADNMINTAIKGVNMKT